MRYAQFVRKSAFTVKRIKGMSCGERRLHPALKAVKTSLCPVCPFPSIERLFLPDTAAPVLRGRSSGLVFRFLFCHLDNTKPSYTTVVVFTSHEK